MLWSLMRSMRLSKDPRDIQKPKSSTSRLVLQRNTVKVNVNAVVSEDRGIRWGLGILIVR